MLKLPYKKCKGLREINISISPKPISLDSYSRNTFVISLRALFLGKKTQMNSTNRLGKTSRCHSEILLAKVIN